MAEGTCYEVKGILVIDPRIQERICANLFRMYCGCQSDCSQLDQYFFKKKKKKKTRIFLEWLIQINQYSQGTKQLAEATHLFNLSKEDNTCQYVVRNPLNNEGKKPSIHQHIFTLPFCKHKCQSTTLEETTHKINKQASKNQIN